MYLATDRSNLSSARENLHFSIRARTFLVDTLCHSRTREKPISFASHDVAKVWGEWKDSRLPRWVLDHAHPLPPSTPVPAAFKEQGGVPGAGGANAAPCLWSLPGA